MLVTLIAASIGMGLFGERLAQRDVAIGIVLALALGFGLLFLHFYTAFATQATGAAVRQRARRGCRRRSGALAGHRRRPEPGRGWRSIARPLLFASLQPELAEAKGVLAAALCGVGCSWRSWR